MRQSTYDEIKWMIDNADLYFVAPDGTIYNIRAVQPFEDGSVYFAVDLEDVPKRGYGRGQ